MERSARNNSCCNRSPAPALTSIASSRAHYATLSPAADAFFAAEDPLTTGKFGVRYSRWSVLFAIASIIGLVNAVLAGAIIALSLTTGAGLATPSSTVIGIFGALIVLCATVGYQRHRVSALFEAGPGAKQNIPKLNTRSSSSEGRQ